MTDEQIAQWIVERDIARKSGNPELIQQAMDHKDSLLMTCIAHQSDRVKSIKRDVETMKDDIEVVKKDLIPCKESDAAFRKARERAKGFQLAIQVAKWIVAAGGGALLVELVRRFPL